MRESTHVFHDRRARGGARERRAIPMSGIGLPHLDADHLVLLSTEANVVEWPRPIPRGATLTARLGERWIRGKLQWSRLTGRTSIRVPATGMCGVLVIQPFWMNDSDGRAAPVDPVAPPRRVLYLPDPILCEECVMYLACTARAPGGGEDVDGERPARMGNVLRGILRSFRVGRWTGADERGETRPGRRASGRLASSSEAGSDDDDDEVRPPDAADSIDDGDDDDDPIAARTRAGRRKQQADETTVGNGHRLRTNPRTSRWSKSSVDDSEEQALLNLARLLFDDSCDAEALMDGCELSGGQGLLHLLNAFGRRLLRLGSRDVHGDANGDTNGYANDGARAAGRGDPQTQTSKSLETSLRASGRFGRSRVMREVAEYGCPDTLRQLFELIGIADDVGVPGLGEALFGGADVPVDDTQLLTPLHVAAAASAVVGEDSTGAATELVRAMIGGCKDPHAWTRGVAAGGVRADQYGVYRAFTGVEAPALNPRDDSDDAEDGDGGSVAWDSETDSETETGTFSRRSGRNETRMTRGSGLNGGSMNRVAPPPRDLAGEDAQCTVHDLYTSAVELAVSALGAVATATAEPFLGELPQSVLEDALQRVIERERDPTLTYLTSLILQDDQCWATFSYIYSLTRGPAQVWLAFPLAPSVDATMRCLGWSGSDGVGTAGGTAGGDDGESIGGEVSNAAQGLGDHDPSGFCQEVASFNDRASRFQETWGLRPLVSQTPWNTRGLMQFKDPAVEAAFLRFADGNMTVAVDAGILVLCLLTSACMVLNGNFALLRGYLGSKPEAVDATTLAVRFFPMLAALTLGLVSACCARLSSNALRVRMGCISAFRLMLAAVSLRSGGAVFHGEDVAFDSAGLAIVPNGERSVFDPGAFADQFGFKTCAFFVLTTIVLPYLLPLRFGDHVVTSFLCGLVSWARFGSFFGVGGMGRMFQSEKDLAVRCALFAAAQVPMYVREYHMRFKFLMNKFGPGNRLEKEKVI